VWGPDKGLVRRSISAAYRVAAGDREKIANVSLVLIVLPPVLEEVWPTKRKDIEGLVPDRHGKREFGRTQRTNNDRGLHEISRLPGYMRSRQKGQTIERGRQRPAEWGWTGLRREKQGSARGERRRGVEHRYHGLFDSTGQGSYGSAPTVKCARDWGVGAREGPGVSGVARRERGGERSQRGWWGVGRADGGGLDGGWQGRGGR